MRLNEFILWFSLLCVPSSALRWCCEESWWDFLLCLLLSLSRLHTDLFSSIYLPHQPSEKVEFMVSINACINLFLSYFCLHTWTTHYEINLRAYLSAPFVSTQRLRRRIFDYVYYINDIPHPLLLLSFFLQGFMLIYLIFLMKNCKALHWALFWDLTREDFFFVCQ